MIKIVSSWLENIKVPIPWLEKLEGWGLWRRPAFLTIDVPEGPDEDLLPCPLISFFARSEMDMRNGFISNVLAVLNTFKFLSLVGSIGGFALTCCADPQLVHRSGKQVAAALTFIIRKGNIQWCPD